MKCELADGVECGRTVPLPLFAVQWVRRLGRGGWRCAGREDVMHVRLAQPPQCARRRQTKQPRRHNNINNSHNNSQQHQYNPHLNSSFRQQRMRRQPRDRPRQARRSAYLDPPGCPDFWARRANGPRAKS